MRGHAVSFVGLRSRSTVTQSGRPSDGPRREARRSRPRVRHRQRRVVESAQGILLGSRGQLEERLLGDVDGSGSRWKPPSGRRTPQRAAPHGDGRPVCAGPTKVAETAAIPAMPPCGRSDPVVRSSRTTPPRWPWSWGSAGRATTSVSSRQAHAGASPPLAEARARRGLRRPMARRSARWPVALPGPGCQDSTAGRRRSPVTPARSGDWIQRHQEVNRGRLAMRSMWAGFKASPAVLITCGRSRRRSNHARLGSRPSAPGQATTGRAPQALVAQRATLGSVVGEPVVQGAGVIAPAVAEDRHVWARSGPRSAARSRASSSPTG